MSIVSRIMWIYIALLACPAFAQEGPELGVAVTADQIASWAISVQPDGTGLPAGSGNAAAGAEVYVMKCLACHGPEGAGGLNDWLVGGHGTISSDTPVRTIGSYWPYATTVFDYIRRAMPLTQPQSLSNDETYAVTAYLLELNGIIDEGDVMDAETVPNVEMLNAGNFIWVYNEK
jgi:mono/diheme cytochrome c family protein